MAPHPDESFGMSHEDYDRTRNRDGGINPNDSIHVERLRESMQWSSKQFKPFVDRHVDAVKYFAGSRYGDNTGLDKTPMNLVRLAIEIWLRQLAAQTPRSLVITRSPELRTDAYELELATAHLLEVTRFGDKLSDAVRSALFSMGIIKVGLSDDFVAEGSGFTHESGQPYAEPVLFEDWLHDMNARNIEEWDWCGNRYRVPLQAVKDNPDFDKNVRDMIMPLETRVDGLGGAYTDNSRTTHSLSAGDAIVRGEYQDHVELWDIWLPSENLFITLPDQAGLGPLSVREWQGPKHGPFHIIAFSKVPGNVMPTPPAQHLVELQDIITRLFNQMARQAERQKTVTIADGRAEADGTAEAIMEAEDGQVIRTSHIDGVKEMKYGGVDQSNMAFTVWLREIFSYLGGNIDAMGGLAQQAGTLGQEQLLVQSSSEMIRDMQAKTITFAEDVITDLAWYMYTDPLIEIPLTKRVEGYGDMPFIWTPRDRQQDFFIYNFKVQPYSLRNKGPSERLQTIMQLSTSLFLPLAPQMKEWGIQLNFQKLVELIAKYSDLPEIIDIISTEMPTMAELVGTIRPGEGGGGDRPLQSPSTQRNYTRQNVSTGGTQQSRDQQMVQSLMKSAQGGRE